MKSMYEHEKEIFLNHADVVEGEYISMDKVIQLLGRDAARYVRNAVKRHPNMAVYRNFHNDVEVLTFEGFLMAFKFFYMMEIKKGLYNAWQTPDYLSRPEFAIERE